MALLRACIAVLALFILSASCLPVDSPDEPEEVRAKRGTKTGAVLGALGGAAVGGKTGAAAGAIGGGLAGHELHKANKHADQANANSAAAFAPVEEEEARVKREGAGKKTGALAGAVAGGVAAGPLGAVGGAILGGLAGHELHKHNHPKTGVMVPADNVRVKREGAGTKTGVLGGAVAGGLVGGPVGALGGAVLGGLAGHELHKANHPKTAIVVPADHVRVRREGAGTKTGALGGAAVGAAAGGPIGAVVGAGVGAVAGHAIHDSNKKADQANVNAAAANANAAPRAKREGAGTKTGALGGAVAGGVVAGPIGAAVGAGIGAVAGHAIHDANRKADQAVVNSAVASGQPVVVAQQ